MSKMPQRRQEYLLLFGNTTHTFDYSAGQIQFTVLSAYLNATLGKESSKKEDCSITEDVRISYTFRFMGTSEIGFNYGHIVQLYSITRIYLFGVCTHK